MKKRLLSVLLCGVLFLSLAACGQTAPQPAASEPPANNAPVAVTPPVLSEPSGVFTDWSKLTAYVPAKAVGTRLSDGPLDTLTPGDYGLLLPYQGERLLAGGWYGGQRMGLVTSDGCVVLDPVCDSIYQASYYAYSPSYPDNYNPGIYILRRQKENPDATDEWDMMLSIYAVCALDGSWCTDFIYQSIYSAPDGVVCLEDNEKNHAVYLDKDGHVLADTRDWDILPQLAPHNAYRFADLYSGPVPLTLSDGGTVFVSMDGQVLETEYGKPFDSAVGFFEGYASVRVEGLWGIIDENGGWVIEPRFEEQPESFLNGQAVVPKRGEGSYIINTEGEILWDSEYNLWPQAGGNGSYLYNAYTSDGETLWFSYDLQPITFPEGMDGSTASLYEELGFVFRTPEGVWVMTDDDTTFFPGALNVNGISDLRIIWYEDDHQEVRNAAGDILATADHGFFYTTMDTVTKEPYLVLSNNIGTNSIYSTAGECLITDWYYSAPVNGLFNCQDAVSAGYKNLNNEWVFRLLMDDGD